MCGKANGKVLAVLYSDLLLRQPDILISLEQSKIVVVAISLAARLLIHL